MNQMIINSGIISFLTSVLLIPKLHEVETPVWFTASSPISKTGFCLPVDSPQIFVKQSNIELQSWLLRCEEQKEAIIEQMERMALYLAPVNMSD